MIQIARDLSAHLRRFRIVRSATLIIAILIGAAFGIRACVTALLVDCYEDTADLPSPDLRHIAHRVVRICKGPLAFNVNIIQFIELSTVGTGFNLRVFESYEDDGSIRWNAGNELAIEVGAVSTIRRSLHEADGVRITYHVPRKLLDLKAAEDSERQTEELHQTGRLTDRDYETGKEIDRWLRRWREDFIRWASENAIIDEPKF